MSNTNIDLTDISKEDYDEAVQRLAEHEEDAANEDLSPREREHAEEMVNFYQRIVDAYNN